MKCSKCNKTIYEGERFWIFKEDKKGMQGTEEPEKVFCKPCRNKLKI